MTSQHSSPTSYVDGTSVTYVEGATDGNIRELNRRGCRVCPENIVEGAKQDTLRGAGGAEGARSLKAWRRHHDY